MKVGNRVSAPHTPATNCVCSVSARSLASQPASPSSTVAASEAKTASDSAFIPAVPAPWPVLGDIALAASPTMATRPADQRCSTTYSNRSQRPSAPTRLITSSRCGNDRIQLAW